MKNYSSGKNLYALARALSKQYRKNEYKSFLVENDFIRSDVLEEPDGRFSGILVKEEFIRETLFFVADGERFYEFIELLQDEGKLSVDSQNAIQSKENDISKQSVKRKTPKDTVALNQNRKLKVFLCHSSNDKPAVRELYTRLKSEGWIDPWLDEEKQQKRIYVLLTKVFENATIL